jgi:hypothetical protein
MTRKLIVTVTLPAAEPFEASAWQGGVPPYVTSETQQVDRMLCRRMKCPRCGQRGFSYRAQHNAMGEYRVLAVSSCSCNVTVEF